jgi:hypothetical protein
METLSLPSHQPWLGGGRSHGVAINPFTQHNTTSIEAKTETISTTRAARVLPMITPMSLGSV